MKGFYMTILANMLETIVVLIVIPLILFGCYICLVILTLHNRRHQRKLDRR